jgi:RNA polymerase sigma factor (sigma-70 family)
VRGVVIDEVRRQHGSSRRGHAFKINRTKHLSDYDFVDPSSGPLDQVLKTEERELMADAVAALPPSTRVVIRLVLAGLPQREIASQIGCSVHTVDYHVRKAKHKLRSAYA